MARLNPDNIEQSKTPMSRTIEESLSSLVISTTPVFIAGVNRKINVGNFESCDVFAGISLPMTGATMEDLETLQKMIEDTATIAFAAVSEQAGKRYTAIKDLQKGRVDKPAT